MSNKLPGVGVVVGRFQVPDLHEGHLGILRKARRHQKMIVFLGVPPEIATTKNPLDYPIREKMIKSYFPDAIVIGIRDNPSNDLWSEELDDRIALACPIFASTKEVSLYSGRDGFARYYKGLFHVQYFDDIKDDSGSIVRDEVGHCIVDNAEFRSGVIYGAYNSMSRTLPTVDIAGVCDGMVLVGKKPNRPGQVVFPGGFVDTTDPSLEAAARRELQEETGAVAEGKLQYIGSFLLDDWRTRGIPSVALMTTLFLAPLMSKSVKAADDLSGVKWISIDDLNTAPFTETHKPLAKELYSYFHEYFYERK